VNKFTQTKPVNQSQNSCNGKLPS